MRAHLLSFGWAAQVGSLCLLKLNSCVYLFANENNNEKNTTKIVSYIGILGDKQR